MCLVRRYYRTWLPLRLGVAMETLPQEKLGTLSENVVKALQVLFVTVKDRKARELLQVHENVNQYGKCESQGVQDK